MKWTIMTRTDDAIIEYEIHDEEGETVCSFGLDFLEDGDEIRGPSAEMFIMAEAPQMLEFLEKMKDKMDFDKEDREELETLISRARGKS